MADQSSRRIREAVMMLSSGDPAVDESISRDIVGMPVPGHIPMETWTKLLLAPADDDVDGAEVIDTPLPDIDCSSAGEVAARGPPVLIAETRCAPPIENLHPAGGVVPTSAVAVKVATLYLSDVYGEAAIRQQRPLRADLSGGVWYVEGTFHGGRSAKGGVAEIQLCRQDGRVLSVIHEK